MDSVRYWVAVVTIVTFPPAFLFWFIIQPFLEFWRRLGARITYATVSVICLGAVWATYTQIDRLLGADLGGHWAMYTLAAVAYLIAAAIGIYAKRHLTWRILVGVPMLKVPEEGPGELLQDGIYAHVRHPRYASVMFGLVSFAALANYVGSWVLTAIFIPVIYLLVIVEEQELIRRFGDDYLAYRAKVPRFIPHPRS